MTNLEDRLKLEAQIQAQEARSQRATVREIYQAVTGRTGEPGDWHGSQPVLALIEERDALRRMSSEFGAALITARARVAELEAQVAEIPDLLLIAHMQGAEQAKDQIQALRAQIEALDCRLAGRVAELSGSHCPADRPCDRCVAERRIEELSHAYAVQGLAIEDLTNERDRYRALLELTK